MKSTELEVLLNQDEIQASNGIKAGFLGNVAREVFLTVLLQDTQPPTPYVFDRWRECAVQAIEICEREVEMSWQKLAKLLALRYYGQDRWDGMATGLQIAWEAAARTMVNWCTLGDDREDRQALDQFDWKKWAAKRLLEVSK